MFVLVFIAHDFRTFSFFGLYLRNKGTYSEVIWNLLHQLGSIFEELVNRITGSWSIAFLCFQRGSILFFSRKKDFGAKIFLIEK